MSEKYLKYKEDEDCTLCHKQLGVVYYKLFIKSDNMSRRFCSSYCSKTYKQNRNKNSLSNFAKDLVVHVIPSLLGQSIEELKKPGWQRNASAQMAVASASKTCYILLVNKINESKQRVKK